MASRATTPELRTRIEDNLTCALCLELYEKPKLLTKCIHSFCEKCLEKETYTEAGKKLVKCQTCQIVTEVSDGGVEQLPNNYFLSNLILAQSLLKAEENKLQCEACYKHEDAQVSNYCTECGHFLCVKCTEAHKRMYIFASHVLLTMEEVQKKDVKALYRPVICSNHPEEAVKMFCKTCQLPMCHSCAITAHKGHSFSEIPEAYIREKETILKHISKAEDLIPPLRAALRSILETKEQLAVNVEERVSHINMLFDSFVEAIEKRRRELLNDIRHLEGRKMKVLGNQREDLENELVYVQAVHEFGICSINNTNPSELLAMKRYILLRLRELTEKEFYLKPQESSQISFYTGHRPEQYIDQFRVFGQVSEHPHIALAAKCQVDGIVADFDSPSTNCPLGHKIVVRAYDSKGQELGTGNAKVYASVTDSHLDVRHIHSTDNHNGTYDLLLQDTPESGSYELSLVVNGEESKDSPYKPNMDSWRFDSSRSEKVELFEQNTDVKGLDGWRSGIIGDVLFTQGRHIWKVQVGHIPDNAVIGIGVCLENDHIDNSLCCNKGNKSTWWYNKRYNSGYRYCPKEGESGCSAGVLKEGDLLILELDMEKHTLTLTNTRSKKSNTHVETATKANPFFYFCNGGSFSLH